MVAPSYTLRRWIFGDVTFAAREEYDEFRYKFLIVLMLAGAGFTLLFVLGEYARVNRIQTLHFYTMHAFIASTLLLWALLRGRKHWFKPLAWAYEAVCMVEYTSSLWLVPADELRLQWFFVNVPGVFLLLGQRAGWWIVALTVLILTVSNTAMAAPYSANAMATAVLSLVYLGVFFHVFGARSISYFNRMRESNQQLEDIASHDALTGVLNGRAYYAQCEVLIALARRSRQPYAVLFVDLDHFKAVNDQHGHAAGDAVLRAVAACLTASIRRTDRLGRIGGEEFSVFLPNTGRAGAMQLAETMRRAIEDSQPDIGSQRLRVTASVGVAVCDELALDMLDIQHQADQAMYLAKSRGRNRVSALDGGG